MQSSSVVSENTVVNSHQKKLRVIVLKRADIFIRRFAALAYEKEIKRNRFIWQQTTYVTELSVDDIKNYIYSLQNQIKQKRDTINEKIEEKRAMLRQRLFDIVASLISKLTNLQLKNSVEKEKFRDAKMRILNLFADDLKYLRYYIFDLRAQIKQSQISIKKQGALGEQNREEKVTVSRYRWLPFSVLNGLSKYSPEVMSPTSSAGRSSQSADASSTISDRFNSPISYTTCGGLSVFSSSTSGVTPSSSEANFKAVSITQSHLLTPTRGSSSGQ